jgi:uncharacterized membrane protein YhaH (DUF805 family)
MSFASARRLAAAGLRLALDPRGRIGRKDMARLALSLMAVQIAIMAAVLALGVKPASSFMRVVEIAALWISIAAASKRLHDAGLSAAWIVWTSIAYVGWAVIVAAATIMITGPVRMTATSPAMIAAVAVSMLPLLAALLWLHLKKGDTGANRYGPATDGPSAPELHRRALPTLTPAPAAAAAAAPVARAA